jgi:hypothetical protein
LAADPDEKSEIAKLREIIDHIESTLVSGVSQKKILETLRTTFGIKMSLGTFKKNLYLIRKKKKTACLTETPKTNPKINTGSQPLIDRADIPAPTTTSNMQTFLTTTQQNSVEEIENNQNHNSNPNAWKDRLNGAARYNELHALGDEYSKEQKRLDKEKKYEQARLNRLGNN